MKRKNNTLIFLLLLGILAVIIVKFSGGKDGEQADITPLLGTWVRTETDMEITYTLNSDNTFSETARSTSGIALTVDDSGKFTFDGTKIVLFSDEFDTETTYEVSVSGNTMYWDSGAKKLEYKKK